MDEIRRLSGEIVLFIDEIHTVVEPEFGEGGLDASNMMKPAYERRIANYWCNYTK